jgi:hypothetical protein
MGRSNVAKLSCSNIHIFGIKTLNVSLISSNVLGLKKQLYRYIDILDDSPIFYNLSHCLDSHEKHYTLDHLEVARIGAGFRKLHAKLEEHLFYS